MFTFCFFNDFKGFIQGFIRSYSDALLFPRSQYHRWNIRSRSLPAKNTLNSRAIPVRQERQFPLLKKAVVTTTAEV
jgi:cytoskeletal protein RodZ